MVEKSHIRPLVRAATPITDGLVVKCFPERLQVLFSKIIDPHVITVTVWLCFRKDESIFSRSGNSNVT